MNNSAELFKAFPHSLIQQKNCYYPGRSRHLLVGVGFSGYFTTSIASSGL